jgi:hypothetical protein
MTSMEFALLFTSTSLVGTQKQDAIVQTTNRWRVSYLLERYSS